MKYSKMRYYRLKLVLVITVIALAGGISLHTSMADTCDNTTNPASDPTAPCFSANNDILAGQRNLLPNDDLNLNLWVQSSSSDSVVDYKLLTSKLDIGSSSPANQSLGACDPGGISAAQTLVGRVFSLANDVMVNLRPTDDCSDVRLNITDPLNKDNNSNWSLGAIGNLAPVAMAMADFNGDGYQDIFVIGKGFAQVLSAKCPNDPFASCTGTAGYAISDGLQAGPKTDVTDFSWYASPPVTGDFNGDGIMDVAWPGYDSKDNIQVRLMSVCPSAGATVLGKTCTEPFEIIYWLAHVYNGGKVNPTSSGTPRPFIALTANNFDASVDMTTGIGDAELLIALGSSDNTSATLDLYDFDANFGVSLKSTTTVSDLYEDESHTLPMFLVSGQLDPTNPRPQAVFGSTKKGGSVEHRGLLTVLSFDGDLNMTADQMALNTGSNANNKTRVFGLAMGRFDPPDDSSSNTDFYQQVAVLVDHNASNTHVQILTIPGDPANTDCDPSSDILCLFTDDEVSSTRYYDKNVPQLVPLQAGDLQGRSLLLGAPEKITVAQTQPDLILGVPPMHVDFIAPPGGGDPQIINVSVFPQTFNIAYDFGTSTETQASHQSSTSYTASTKETVESKVTFGVPDVDSVSVKTKDSATQMHQNTVSNAYNTYSKLYYGLMTTTEFNDKVAGASLRMNIYSYPVIGQSVCPSGSPNCTDDQKVPLQVQYSAPDNIVHIKPTEAKALPWYQPVTEPGEIFSYPGSLGLLEAGGPKKQGTTDSALDLLTPADNLWDSQSSESVEVSWSAGGGQSASSGSTNTDSFETDVSVSGKASFEGGSASAGASVDTNTSTSISTLNTSSQTFDSSMGVILDRGVNNNDSNYLYTGQSFIYGLKPPAGTIQTDLTPSTQVTTHGRIEVGHVADILSDTPIESGNWWGQAYGVAPDVALNHPERWAEQEPNSQHGQEVMFNCPIGFASSFGLPTDDPGVCTKTQPTTQPSPVNVTDAAFYWMKGLFITPGTSTTGPATTLAALGDTVTLQARVYNYSLKNMAEGTAVHIQFYAQPWDGGQTGQFSAGGGTYGFAKAVFIGEDIVGPIPAFCGGAQGSFDACTASDAPLNWVLAKATWNTGTLSPLPTTDTNWIFWVVAWMEDGSGNLVPEIAQHGLTQIPTQAVDSLAQVPVETYSNNLGFYEQVFTLEIPTSSAVQAPAPASTERHLAIEPLEGLSSVFLRDEISTLRIRLSAGGGRFDYVRAFLYEGDPRSDGKLMDMAIIPKITEDSPFVVPFRYRAWTCGPQRLFLEASSSDGGLSVEGTLDVTVTLDPQARTRYLIARIENLALAPGMKRSLLAKLQAAEQSFGRGRESTGFNQLHAFVQELAAVSGRKLPSADVEPLSAAVADLEQCRSGGGR